MRESGCRVCGKPVPWPASWYIKSIQIFQCPSEPNPDNGGNVNSLGYTDYAYNYVLGLDVSNTSANSRGLSEAALLNTTLTVMFLDFYSRPSYSTDMGCDGIYYLSGCTAGELSSYNISPSYTTNPAWRHLEGQNYAFCDGHVKWYKGLTGTKSAVVYNARTPFSTSGNNPTFNTDIP